MCGKKCYDKRGALGELKFATNRDRRYRRKNKERREIRYYYCNICNAHHLTSREYNDQILTDFVNKEEFFNKLKQTIEISE